MKGRHITSAAAVFLLLAFSAWTPVRGQAPAAPQIADAQVYDGFIAWIKPQPSIRDLPTALERYRQVLAEQGFECPEIERRIQVIVQYGRRVSKRFTRMQRRTRRLAEGSSSTRTSC